MVLSTSSSKSIEEVAGAGGDAARWFQLYWPRDPELAASFLLRAEESGYSAVVVTLDTWLLGWRPRDLQGAYLPFLWGEGVANYFSDPVFRAALAKPPEEDLQAAVGHWINVFSDATVSWENLAFLRQNTSLPILLKGIVHPDDARQAVDYGMDGIVVSNHGGRQVDGAIAALDALPGVVEAVPAGYPVLFDGGIRTGADVFKAVALGAHAVLLGRPYMWGLALGGQDGVSQVVKSLLAELDLTVALAGQATLEGVDSSTLTRISRQPGPGQSLAAE
jgi:isopentenyl diphosphate isomerase/L-lactate dehydrogenase-like FMN-dependent dehydrogenase